MPLPSHGSIPACPYIAPGRIECKQELEAEEEEEEEDQEALLSQGNFRAGSYEG